MMIVYRDIDKLEFTTRRIISVGSFDGVHIGHRNLIMNMVAIANKKKLRSMIITFEPHPQIYFAEKKNFIATFPLLSTIDEKNSIFGNLGIDEVLILKFDDVIAATEYSDFVMNTLLAKIGFSTIVIGETHFFGKNRLGNYNTVKNIRMELLRQNQEAFDVIKIEQIMVDDIRVSSTIIRQILLNSYVEMANHLLGYDYFVTGLVVEGQKIGRNIGFPTANIQIDTNKLMLKNGVYVTTIDLLGNKYRSITNIGIRPTVSQLKENKPTIEVHIFDFAEDIYNVNVVVCFKKFIREEKKFENINALMKQIEKDKSVCTYFFNNIVTF